MTTTTILKKAIHDWAVDVALSTQVIVAEVVQDNLQREREGGQQEESCA
jgi:hypothetical protein